jgi:hypothetical protein
MSIVKGNHAGLGGAGAPGGALAGGGAPLGSHAVAQSLRFDGSTAYLTKSDFGTATDTAKRTFSTWVKRGDTEGVAAYNHIIGAGSSGIDGFGFQSGTGKLQWIQGGSATKQGVRDLRDTSAWYHFFTTWNATDNELFIYVNGELDYSDTGSLSALSKLGNTGHTTYLGKRSNASTYINGYLAETVFLDGYIGDVNDFGELVSGVWVPKEIDTSSITFGNNGFYLPFAQDFTAGNSISFSGTSDRVEHADATAYDIGASDDFTIEFFFKTTDVGSDYGHFMGDYATGGPHHLITYDFRSSTRDFYFYSNNGQALKWAVAGDVTVSNGTWHHVVFQRDGTTLRAYIDGTRLTSVSNASSSWSLSNGKATNFNKDYNLSRIRLGNIYTTVPIFGSLSNVRYVIGNTVYADDDNDITVPTETLTAVTGTKLLTAVNSTLGDDISTENNDGTTSGSPVLSYDSPFTTSNFFEDASGNGNDFTVNNLDTSDVVPDSPTNNFATFNNIVGYAATTDPVFSEGNLKTRPESDGISYSYTGVGSTINVSSGKWYAEFKPTATSGVAAAYLIGIIEQGLDRMTSNSSGTTWDGGFIYTGGGKINGSGNDITSSWGDTYTTNDVIGVAIDMDDGKVWFSKNGTFQASGDPAAGTNAAFTTLKTYNDTYAFSVGCGQTSSQYHQYEGNFGQNPSFNGTFTGVDVGTETDGNGIGLFKYAPPSGFLALCSANLPEPAIGPNSTEQADDYFETMLYTGTGAVQHIGSGGAQHPQDTTTIANSLVFNRAGEHELARTFGSGGSRRKWTFSTWIKRTALLSSGNDHYIFGTNTGAADSTFMMLVWRATDALAVTGQSTLWLKSNNSFGDTSGWYHIVWVLDSDNATDAEKMRLYVDGTELTSFATDSRSSLSGDQAINAAVEHNLGVHPSATGYGLDAYLADTIFVDGQAYGPEEFGQVGSNGYWIPKAYSGTYGNTGFKLTYEGTGTATTADGTTAQTNIGDDQSGSGRNFGIIGSTIDSHDVKIDSPTQNFATFDPSRPSGTPLTLSEGNLKAENTSSGFAQAYSIFEMTSGKWYAEFLLDTGNSGVGVIAGTTIPGANRYMGQDSYTYGYYVDGRKVNNATYTTYGDSYTTAADGSGDVIGVLIDADNGNISFSKNGTVQNSGTPAFSGIQGPFKFAIASESNCFHIANFGQDDTFSGLKTSGSAGAADGNGYGKFYDTPPTDYLALVDDNIPQEGINSPDLVIIKGRSAAKGVNLFDTVRGPNIGLFPNGSNDEFEDTDRLLAFQNNGFTLGGDVNVNESSTTFASWNWKAGGKANTFNIDGTGYATIAASPISDGDIPLTGLSANTTAGFSIASWSSTNTDNQTIAHGLSATPELIISKSRNTAATDWWVWAASESGKYGRLNSTNAWVSDTSIWYTAGMSSTTFGVRSLGNNYLSRTYIAYCFHSVEGYSKFGSFVGNSNADGTFVYLGFRPAYIWLKRHDANGVDWSIFDNKRLGYNVDNNNLRAFAGTVATEQTDDDIDFLSNGFKCRRNFANNQGDVLYFAWAEQPFKYANAR